MGSKQSQRKSKETWRQVCGCWAVFEDENAITIEDEHESEDRFITIGRDFLRRILVVVYTFRGLIIRLISARKATAREKKINEEQQHEE